MKINIAFIIPPIKNTGLINLVSNIIKNLDNKVFQVILIIINEDYVYNCNCNDAFFKNNFLSSLQQIHPLLNYFYVNKNNLVEDTESILTKNKIDIIHSHGFYPDKLASKIELPIIKITTIHCMFFKDYNKEYGLLKGVIGSLLHLYYINNNSFSKIIACSSSVKKYLNNLIHQNNLLFINNGVDQNLFYPITLNNKKYLRYKLQLDKYDKIFIYSGRLIKRKQVPKVINLFNNYLLNNNNDCLLILGNGEELEICKNTAKHPNIIFLGHQNNPEIYYQISDFVVSMSSAEGYPMSILEAVSCGCYAFLSNIPPHMEFILENPNMADDIKNLSNQSLDNTIVTNFSKLSAKTMADKYSQVYLELLGVNT